MSNAASSPIPASLPAPSCRGLSKVMYHCTNDNLYWAGVEAIGGGDVKVGPFAGVSDCAPTFSEAAVSAIPRQDAFIRIALHDGIRIAARLSQGALLYRIRIHLVSRAQSLGVDESSEKWPTWT